MKKGLIISLAVLSVLVLTTAAWATDWTVVFNAINPDINVNAYCAYPGRSGAPPSYLHANFSLTGTGTATGEIHASTDSGGWGRANVAGGYEAHSGDFESSFSSYIERFPGTWDNTRTSLLNAHRLGATGVGSSSLYVDGAATAIGGWNYCYRQSSASHNFEGDAESLSFSGARLWETWDLARLYRGGVQRWLVVCGTGH